MALVVEDGTGLSTADSYISETDADTYVTNYLGGDAGWTAADTATREQALREATRYLDITYQRRWKGIRLNETMSLDWPRQSVLDEDEYLIDDATVPQRVKDATVEMAVRVLALAAGGDLTPDLLTPGDIESESVKVGPITESIKYLGGKGTRTVYPKIESLLSGLLSPLYIALRG